MRSRWQCQSALLWWLKLGGALALAMIPIIFPLDSAGGTAPWATLPTYIANSAVISAASAALRMRIGELLDARRAALPMIDTAPRLMSRLKPALQSASLQAIKSEGHYVQVYTDLGQEMLLLRFGDAIGETGGCAGMQAHRCWWVAKSAIDGAANTDGKLELVLANGGRVPVSRSYRAVRREAGWL